ncbi:hypothetical protein BDN67DRAFT_1013825 [Paxillus ammoniavirescens]|nr:hypothetical protein BDN67DRAFT_1013825 [Paxillus ammoniavirescens]
MAEFPQLASDGRNWMEYHEKLEDMLTGHKLAQYITGTETTQRDSEFWRAQNNLAKRTIVVTIHPCLAVQIRRLETARKGYETLKSLFEKTTTTPTATTRVLDDIRNNGTARDTAYSPETTNNRVCRRSHVMDMSRCDDDRQHQRETKGQGRVEGREEVGRMGRTPPDTSAAVEEATDTVNPNVKDVRPTVPVGTTNELSNGTDERVKSKKGGEEDEKGEWASGDAAPSSNDNGGDESVRHTYVVPNATQPPPYHALPTPDERRRPPSTPLEGESGQQTSRRADKTATHQVEAPQTKSTTQQPRQTPYDQRSNREGRGVATSHREAAGARDEVEVREVEGSRDDEEAPPPPPSPSHPERHHDDDDDLKSNTMATRTCADAVHDPGVKR